MFTGLVEHQARLQSRVPKDTDGGFTLTFDQAGPILEDCAIGDSIAVNGACLTVVWFDQTSFKVGLAPETLTRTNLGELKVGDRVNCERAMSSHTRFGGHFVQGHVDTTATIASKTPDGNSIRYTFTLDTHPSLPAPSSLSGSLIPKGYVTIDGTSLTLTECGGDGFGIMLIAHSQEKVTLAGKEVGERVNVEVDSVGKFVGKAVEGALSGQGELGRGLERLIERVVERVLRERKLI